MPELVPASYPNGTAVPHFNGDGSYSTVESETVRDPFGRWVNLRTTGVADPWGNYLDTGEQLGIYDDPAEAEAEAEAYHQREAARWDPLVDRLEDEMPDRLRNAVASGVANAPAEDDDFALADADAMAKDMAFGMQNEWLQKQGMIPMTREAFDWIWAGNGSWADWNEQFGDGARRREAQQAQQAQQAPQARETLHEWAPDGPRQATTDDFDFALPDEEPRNVVRAANVGSSRREPVIPSRTPGVRGRVGGF